ncbi:MAG: wax ester/triacylglycerol synthase family O-acyltransferase [Myxococcota bacterium]
MDALSPQDSSFLFVENEINPMHIAMVAIFEGPPPHSDEIEQMISSKLDQVPRYRQKVRFMPFDLGQPIWVDDERFELQYHVRHTALPNPGSVDQLYTLVGRIMSHQLDRARPLWESWVVEGLEGDRWALISKTHHCLVDGVAGADLMSVLLDASPEAEHVPSPTWSPERKPSTLAMVAHSLSDNWRLPREGIRAFGRVATTPRRALRTLGDFSDGLATFRKFTDAPLEGSLNGPIGAHRRWRSAETTLKEIKRIRQRHGGTVNDTVLTAIALAFRDLLIARDEPIEGMRVRSMVPVSVRRKEERGTLNNRVSAVFVDLPVDIEDPALCLEAIRQEMDRIKAHHQADAAETLTALTGNSPPALLALGARLVTEVEQHTVQTITTNVPGPREPLYAAGREMISAFPYVPLVGSVRIAIAIFSYAGKLSFGVTGDYEGAPDLDVLTEGIESALSLLLEGT